MMMSELLLDTGPGRRLQRACGDRLWMVFAAMVAATLTFCIVAFQPFALIRNAVRAGGSASYETLYLAAISVALLAEVVAVVVCVSLYLYGMHAAGRLR
jgi:hypothetical protein